MTPSGSFPARRATFALGVLLLSAAPASPALAATRTAELPHAPSSSPEAAARAAERFSRIFEEVGTFPGKGKVTLPVPPPTMPNPIRTESSSFWSPRFTLPGFDSAPRVIEGDGTVAYVGGYFEIAGGVRATGVARWDGSDWSSVGSNLYGDVRALLADGGSLYAAGYLGLEPAGLALPFGVARWDGTAWQPVGNIEPFYSPCALARDGADLLLASRFSSSDTTILTRWNGVNWTLESPPVVSSIFTPTSVAVLDGTVFVGGLAGSDQPGTPMVFRESGGVWSVVLASSYAYDAVTDLAVKDGVLYAGIASYDGTGYGPAVIRWDGSSWSATDPAVYGVADDLEPTATGLAVCGYVYTLGYTAMGDVVELGNGSLRWRSDESVGNARQLASRGNALVSLGDRYHATPGGYLVFAPFVGEWDGSHWRSLDGRRGEGVGLSSRYTSQVTTLREIDGRLYAAGYFDLTREGGAWKSLGPAVEWTGSGWSDLGLGSTVPLVGDIVSFEGDLVVSLGGGYGSSGPPSVYRRRGDTWEPLPGAPLENALAIAVWNGSLYLSSYDRASGSPLASHVRRYRAGTWEELPSPTPRTPAPAYVRSLVPTRAGLVALGPFSVPPVYGARLWNGSSWQELNDRLEGTVEALAPLGAGFVVSGQLRVSVGGVPRNAFLALFDGANWSVLEVRPLSGVSALAATRDAVFAAGGGLRLNGGSTSGVLRLDARGWTQFGEPAPPSSRLMTTILSLLPSGGGLWVGGRFSAIAGRPASNVARWEGPLYGGGFAIGSAPRGKATLRASGGGGRLTFALATAGRARLAIYDVTGARRRTLADGAFDAGERTLDWDGRDDGGRPLAAGVYFARLEADGAEPASARFAHVR